jgi:hypothetical protein
MTAYLPQFINSAAANRILRFAADVNSYSVGMGFDLSQICRKLTYGVLETRIYCTADLPQTAAGRFLRV